MVSVMDCGAVVTVGAEENVRLVPVKVVAGAMPLPVTLTVWGELAALSVTEMAAVSVPVVVGVKVTKIVQLPVVAGSAAAVQLSVCE